MIHKIRYQGKEVHVHLHSEVSAFLGTYLESIIERTLEFAFSVKEHNTLSQYLNSTLLFLCCKKPDVIDVHFVAREDLNSESIPKNIREKILDLDESDPVIRSHARLFDASTNQMPWKMEIPQQTEVNIDIRIINRTSWFGLFLPWFFLGR